METVESFLQDASFLAVLSCLNQAIGRVCSFINNWFRFQLQTERTL